MAVISEAIAGVLSRVKISATEAGRTADSIRLVAVSKTKPLEALVEAYEAGQRHFGENYVQEIVQKAPKMPNDIKWHFIGHVQSGKVKELMKIPNLFMVETIDSTKLADTFQKRFDSEITKEPLNILVQVNTSGEESKSGVEPKNCNIVVSHILKHCANLKFKGLMTIGKLGDSDAQKYFERLVECKKNLFADSEIQPLLDENSFELSMGMSGDFEQAVKAGSTNIRVGSTIFGARDYTKK